MIKQYKTWYHSTPYELFYPIPTEQNSSFPWKWQECAVSEFSSMHFVLHKLPITTKIADIKRFSTDISFISPCRGGLYVYNGDQTNFIMPSDHELW